MNAELLNCQLDAVKDREEQHQQISAKIGDSNAPNICKPSNMADACGSGATTQIAPEGTFKNVSRLGILYLALRCFSDQEIDCFEEVKNIELEGSLKRKRVSWHEF